MAWYHYRTKIVKKRFSLSIPAIMFLGTIATSGESELSPLAKIVEDLKGETDPNHAIQPVASRCLANRSWTQVRFMQSYEITQDASEKELADTMAALAVLWLPKLMGAASSINPSASKEEIWEQIQTQNQLQVEAYTASAETQKALTGHYIPETALDDARICSRLEQGMN